MGTKQQAVALQELRWLALLAKNPQGHACRASCAQRRCPAPLPPWRSRAKELCPDLVVVPYMFDKYEEASEKVGRSRAAGLRRASVLAGGRVTRGAGLAPPCFAPHVQRKPCLHA